MYVYMYKLFVSVQITEPMLTELAPNMILGYVSLRNEYEQWEPILTLLSKKLKSMLIVFTKKRHHIFYSGKPVN